MSALLDRCFANARSRADAQLTGAKAAAVSSAFLATGLVGQGALGASQPGMTPGRASAAELLRHDLGEWHANVRVISQRGASQPVRMGYRVRGKPRKGVQKDYLPESLKNHHAAIEQIEEHPFLAMIDKPNPVWTGWMLREASLRALMTVGEFHWWIKLSEEDDSRLEAWYVPAPWMEPVHEEGRPFNRWRMIPSGGNLADAVYLPREQVFHAWIPDLRNPLAPHSPLAASSRPVVASEACWDAQRLSYRNGLWPGMAFTVGRHPDIATGRPGERPYLSATQRQQLVALLKQQYRGILAFDEPIILDALIQDAKKITNSPREMDFMRTGGYLAAAVARMAGVSPYSNGSTEPGSRAASSEADKHLLKNTLNPKLELVSGFLAQYVGPLFSTRGGPDLLAWIEPAVPIDPDYVLDEERFLSSIGALLVDEARARHSLPPLPGKYGQVCWINPQLVPTQIMEKDIAPPPASPPGKAPPARPAPAEGDAENEEDGGAQGAD